MPYFHSLKSHSLNYIVFHNRVAAVVSNSTENAIAKEISLESTVRLCNVNAATTVGVQGAVRPHVIARRGGSGMIAPGSVNTAVLSMECAMMEHMATADV